MKATLTTKEDTLTLIRDFVEEVTEAVGYDSDYTRVDDISSESYDGFIAFTDGGWNGVASFGFYSSASYETPLIEPYLKRDFDDCITEFKRQYDLEDAADIYAHPEWENFQTEWEMADDSPWYAYVRAILYTPDNRRNESGEDEVLLCFGINDDFGYGRDSIGWCKGGTTWLWERNIPLSQVTPELLAECRKELLDKW